MPHLLHRGSAAATLGVLALSIVAPSPAAGQTPAPASASWEALPRHVPAGSTVVVTTRDGHSAEGRLRSLSDTAIVIEGGSVRTIPAAAVVSIEGGHGRRPVRRGAEIGGAFGALFALGLAAPVLTEGYCTPGESTTWTDALIGAVVLPAMGAGIGAGIGLMAPGRRTLVYSAGQPDSLAQAAWHALPRQVPEGARVVVKTRDGQSTKGRLRGLSDSAIVVESGGVKTIPAEAVASIEESRGGRSFGRGARVGAAVGAALAVMMAGSAMSTEFCDCDRDEALGYALLGALAAPAIGAGIGAGVGRMVPARRTLFYRAGADVALGV